ncbi:MAG: amidohydrolase [Acidimicrobiia bacterium]|nr:amidohydrolase [Acidimicrobiia bacterium]
MATAYTNATLHTAAGSAIEDGTLVVDGGKIIAVGTAGAPKGADVVDLDGAIVWPGMIDCHSHAGVASTGDWNDHDVNEMSEKVTPHVRVLDAIHPADQAFDDARRAGVTLLGITHGSGNVIGGQVAACKTAGMVADEMVIKEPAGVKMALGENPKRVGDRLKRAPTTRMGNAYLAREAFVAAQEYKLDWEHHEARVAAESAKPEDKRKPVRPPSRDLGKEILVRVLDGEIPIRNHAHRLDDIRTAIRLSEEFGYRLVLDHATEAYKIPDEIVSRGIMLAIGPVGAARGKRETRHRTSASAGLMVAAGATVAVMTDAPVDPVQHLRDMAIISIRDGLPQDRALETITINAAKILGVEDRVGSLEVGKDADFIVFEADPWDARSPVVATYIDGKKVFEYDGPWVPATEV